MHCGRFINCGLTRRDLLLRSGAGFGSLAAAALFREPAFGRASPTPQPSQDRKPARRARTRSRPSLRIFRRRPRSVIFLFMDGGPSQVDTFDPKPRLDREHGQPIKVKTHPTQFNNVGKVIAVPGNSVTMARAGYRSATCSRMSASAWTNWRSFGRWYPISPSIRRRIISCTQAAACRAGPAMARGSPMVWGVSARTCQLLWCSMAA